MGTKHEKSAPKLLRMATIADYAALLGVEPQHPLVQVVDLSTLHAVRHGLKRFGFYGIFLKELVCGTLLYGRSRYDYAEGTLVFVAPGQIAGVDDEGETLDPKGMVLLFHPDLIYGTPLARRMGDYAFFAYDSNEALHISERERAIVVRCFRAIAAELEQPDDRHTKRIVASLIEVLLNHCLRFYDRQFATREPANRDLLGRFEKLLQGYFDSELPRTQGLPTVQYCARELHLSANYFGDLVKKSTGKSAQEWIQLAIVERAKRDLLERENRVGEIAYKLGFRYPHHLSRLFKRVVGVTPGRYRAADAEPLLQQND